MGSWLISVPAWGPHHTWLALTVLFPCIKAALAESKLPGRVIVHTDRAYAFKYNKEHLDIEIRPISQSDGLYNKLSDAHRDALSSAQPGEYIAALTADSVLSREVLVACERRFATGKKAVVCTGQRTLADAPPPIGAAAAELSEWALANLHPINQECFWGTGRSAIPAMLYFKFGESLVVHAFHLHPIAIVADRPLIFKNTIDDDLLDRFTEEEIHVVQDVNELAVVECSPAEKVFPLTAGPISIEYVVRWAATYVTPRHKFLFRHPIILRGGTGPFAWGPAHAILNALVEQGVS